MIEIKMYTQILEEAENFCKLENLASSTTKGRLGNLSRILQGISQITTTILNNWLENYISKRTGHLLGPHGKNAYIIALNWYFSRTKKFTQFLPIIKELKRHKTESKGKIMEMDIFESILEFCPTIKHELAFRLIYECAFRPHEILSIRVCDIKETQEQFGPVIVQLPAKNPVTPSGRNKTGGRSIIVMENATDLLTLKNQIQKTDGNSSLLFSWKHKHLSVTFCIMKRKLIEEEKEKKEKSNENIEIHNTVQLGRLYDCRHTSITGMYVRDVPDQIIRKMVGWTPSSKMPNTYVHINEAHMLAAHRKTTTHPKIT